LEANGFYDGSVVGLTSTQQQPPITTNKNENKTNKYRNNQYQQQQQQIKQHYQIQQNQNQFTTLLEHQNHDNSKVNHQTESLQSTTDNSNLFSSPPLSSSASSNRRLATNTSFLQKLHYRLNNKLKTSFCCSWKFIALLFLFILLNLIVFSIYLILMRQYGLNWSLELDNNNGNKHSIDLASSKSHQTTSNSDLNGGAIFFTKLNKLIKNEIDSQRFYHLQLYVDNDMFIKFNLSLNRNGQIGVYINRDTLPSFTKFNYFEKFQGDSLLNSKNRSQSSFSSNDVLVNTGFVQFLKKGLWFISLFNDNPKDSLKFNLEMTLNEIKTTNSFNKCQHNCHGKGECVLNSVCKCFPGFSGIDCSIASCPIVCNNHGKYQDGKCVCDLPWKGKECELTVDQCLDPNCSQNGNCIKGKCKCFIGYQGDLCEKRSCGSDCSGNGVCVEGECACFKNFTGSQCNEQVTASVHTILCSSHGSFDLEAKMCRCESGWSGLDCSFNVNCLNLECTLCHNGWGGDNCLERVPFTCDPKCNINGICVNGTCNCSPGFQGRNCDISNE
jgi:teneurin